MGTFQEKHTLITVGLIFIGSNLAHSLIELGSNVSILNRQIHGLETGKSTFKALRNRYCHEIFVTHLKWFKSMSQQNQISVVKICSS